MRRLLSLLVLGVAVFLVVVATGSASAQRRQACKSADKAGNWEVVLGTASSAKAATKIVSRASAKGLHASMERIGCSRRYEVVITAATKAAAATTLAQAKKDGFTKATEQQS